MEAAPKAIRLEDEAEAAWLIGQVASTYTYNAMDKLIQRRAISRLAVGPVIQSIIANSLLVQLYA